MMMVKLMKNAGGAAFGLFLFWVPAQAFGAVGTGPCDKDVVVESVLVNESTGKHSYRFRGKCNHGDYIGATINWSFDPATGVLNEQVRPDAGNGLMNMSYSCQTDEDGLAIRSCTLTGKSSTGPYDPVFKIGGGSLRHPMTGPFGPAMREYLSPKISGPPPPAFLYPPPGVELPLSEPLRITIRKGELSVWHKLAVLYAVPKTKIMEGEAARHFLLEVQLFQPGEGGGTWRTYAERFLEDGIIWHGGYIYPEDGMYRIRARHQKSELDTGSQYPWSPWLVFWVGDRVDYAKAVPTLVRPVPNAVVSEGTTSGSMTSYPVTFLATGGEPKMTSGDTIEFTWHYNDHGVWRDTFEGSNSTGVPAELGVEKVQFMAEGVYRVRVRYLGGTYPWSEWHYFLAGNPPGGGDNPSVNAYLPNLRIIDEPYKVMKNGPNVWEISMEIHYTGYWNFLEAGPEIKSIVACIPMGDQTCGTASPNPSVQYAGNWHPQDVEPGMEWGPQELPAQYIAVHKFVLRPEVPFGKWIFVTSVDPHNFIDEVSEHDNAAVWVLDASSGLFEDGLPALEQVIEKTGTLPEGIDGKMMESLRRTGSRLPTGAAVLSRSGEGRAVFGGKTPAGKRPPGALLPGGAHTPDLGREKLHPPEPGKAAIGGGTALVGPAKVITAKEAGTPVVSAGGAKAALRPKADLAVKRVTFTPDPIPEGKTVTMEVTLKNGGRGASTADAAFEIGCRDTKGGRPCPVSTGKVAVGRAIPPGGEGSVTLVAPRPAEAGEYRLTISLPSDGREPPWSKTVTVSGRPAAAQRVLPGAAKPKEELGGAPQEEPAVRPGNRLPIRLP